MDELANRKAVHSRGLKAKDGQGKEMGEALFTLISMTVPLHIPAKGFVQVWGGGRRGV